MTPSLMAQCFPHPLDAHGWADRSCHGRHQPPVWRPPGCCCDAAATSRHPPCVKQTQQGEQGGQLIFCIMTAWLMDICRGRRCERGNSSGGERRWAGRSLHQEPLLLSPAIASTCLGRGGIARLNQYTTAGFIFIPGIFKLLMCSTAVTEPAVRQCLSSPF